MTTALKPGEGGGGFPYVLWFVYLLGTHPFICAALLLIVVIVAATVVSVSRRRKKRKTLNPTT